MRKKVLKKVTRRQDLYRHPSGYKVSKEFMDWVEKFMDEHDDALRELAKR